MGRQEMWFEMLGVWGGRISLNTVQFCWKVPVLYSFLVQCKCPKTSSIWTSLTAFGFGPLEYQNNDQVYIWCTCDVWHDHVMHGHITWHFKGPMWLISMATSDLPELADKRRTRIPEQNWSNRTRWQGTYTKSKLLLNNLESVDNWCALDA